MSCDPELLKQVALFSLLDAEERSVLASHVELRRFEAQQRIYNRGDKDGRGYVVLEGSVCVSLIDQDEQEVVLDEPMKGEFFGFASLLEGTAHLTSALAVSGVTCIEIEREDLRQLLLKKPESGMDMLAMLGRQFHAAHRLVQVRSLRNPNDMIEEQSTWGDKLADGVARFGGSWRFISSMGVILLVYVSCNVILASRAWDPYPFILLNLFLSMLAAIQAPVIMMSQNRLDSKDRMRGELDFEVNRRAELEIRHLSGKIHELTDKIHDVERRLWKGSEGTVG